MEKMKIEKKNPGQHTWWASLRRLSRNSSLLDVNATNPSARLLEVMRPWLSCSEF